MFKVFIVLLSLWTLQGVMSQCDFDPDNANEYCKTCFDKRNQMDYYYDPCNCQTYYHCQFFGNGTAIATLRDCGAGFRYDNSTLQCVPLPLGVTDCNWEDPCRDNETVQEAGRWAPVTIPFGGLEYCGLYYTCSNYYSIVQCCPNNTRFNDTSLECDIRDDTCNAHANLDYCSGGATVPMPPAFSVAPGICFDPRNFAWRAPFTDAFSFYQHRENATATAPSSNPPGDDWVLLKCAPGSSFDFETCKCTIEGGVTYAQVDEACLVELNCDSTDGAVDTGVHRAYIDFPERSGVVAFGKASCDFNGTNWMEIPFFGGNSLRNRFTIAFKIAYSCTDNVVGADPIPILNNRAKTDLILASTLASVRFEFSATNTVSAHIFLKYSPVETLVVDTTCSDASDVWNHIFLTYDGQFLSLTSQNEGAAAPLSTSTVPVSKPNVDLYWMLHCPWVVADDWMLPSRYDGAFDRLYVCRSVKTAADIIAFLTADV
jgi:hypothetical protein